MSSYCPLYRAIYLSVSSASTHPSLYSYCPLYRAIYFLFTVLSGSNITYCPLYRAIYVGAVSMRVVFKFMLLIALYIGLSTEEKNMQKNNNKNLLPSISGYLLTGIPRIFLSTPTPFLIALYIGLST